MEKAPKKTDTEAGNRSRLAHDIKNVLATIRMDAEIMTMGSHPEGEYRETLTHIIEEIDRIAKMLDSSKQ